VYQDITDETPMHLYAKQNPLIIPKAMTSFGPDGGIVSTSPEMIRFLYAFFNGVFFPVAVIDTLKTWNRIFFPMQSGIGIHRFSLPWILNPFGTVPELIGHSGLSGALAYCNPAKNLFISGTVNQVAYPDTSFKLAIKLITTMMK
jgi:CubicO group peptidase (beta-lactamase class C family)